MKDKQLLLEYAANRSEAAFNELVRRHVDLTYSVALRLVRDPHLAEDVTQAVFVALAQNAAQLVGHPVLSGWLHRAARNVAAQTVRSETRRRTREQESAAMNDLIVSDPETSLDHFGPHLDEALASLDEADRDAILLRYFEKKSAQEMAGILGISAEAAQKRVSRAVEQLREAFAKRGAVVASGALVIWLSANSVQAAPVTLAANISMAATLAGAAASTTSVALGSTATAVTATKVGSIAIMNKILVVVAFTAVAGFGIYEARQAGEAHSQNNDLRAQLAVAKEAASPQSTVRQPPVTAPNPLSSDGDSSSPTLLNLTPTGGAQSLPTILPAVGQYAEHASNALEQMKEQQQKMFMESQAGGGGMIAGTGGYGFPDHSNIGTKSVNGVTIIVFKGREFPVGKTKGRISAKAATIDGKDFAAAFEDDRVVWENIPGAAERLK